MKETGIVSAAASSGMAMCVLAQVAGTTDMRSILEITDCREEILRMTYVDEAWSMEMMEPGALRWMRRNCRQESWTRKLFADSFIGSHPARTFPRFS